MEMLKPAPGTREFFKMMREAHRNWDGADHCARWVDQFHELSTHEQTRGYKMSYYLLATLKVKFGQQRKFYEVMSHLKPVLEKAGWKLVGAYENAIGRLNTVNDLWEINDPNAVPSTLAVASQDADFVRWAANLPELLEEEVLQIMTKVPYSP